MGLGDAGTWAQAIIAMGAFGLMVICAIGALVAWLLSRLKESTDSCTRSHESLAARLDALPDGLISRAESLARYDSLNHMVEELTRNLQGVTASLERISEEIHKTQLCLAQHQIDCPMRSDKGRDDKWGP